MMVRIPKTIRILAGFGFMVAIGTVLMVFVLSHFWAFVALNVAIAFIAFRSADA
ncbi:MAG: hypothetical protein HY340_04150 [Candidatus Kerfeldbacteria bacterium]|nr:hypothetical protein [Candidatus Kerfeldbacteria bacterium]